MLDIVSKSKCIYLELRKTCNAIRLAKYCEQLNYNNIYLRKSCKYVY